MNFPHCNICHRARHVVRTSLASFLDWIGSSTLLMPSAFFRCLSSTSLAESAVATLCFDVDTYGFSMLPV